ncbi:MAG: cytochrome c oxidase assembly protein [bacterium]|nr:cytochrome c oxidase assembly protein [bacterium]
MIHWTTWELLAATWFWDPSIFIGSAALLLIYWKWGRPRTRRQTIFFRQRGAGDGVFALVSPLETLGDTYLFSAHMLQHLLLLLVTPPMLLLGLPPEVAQRIVAEPFLGMVERVLRRPYIAWPLGVLTIWVWHIPALYNATLADEQIHILEHVLFMVTAVIFWWPILSPLPASRIPPLAVIPICSRRPLPAAASWASSSPSRRPASIPLTSTRWTSWARCPSSAMAGASPPPTNKSAGC